MNAAKEFPLRTYKLPWNLIVWIPSSDGKYVKNGKELKGCVVDKIRSKKERLELSAQTNVYEFCSNEMYGLLNSSYPLNWMLPENGKALSYTKAIVPKDTLIAVEKFNNRLHIYSERFEFK